MLFAELGCSFAFLGMQLFGLQIDLLILGSLVHGIHLAMKTTKTGIAGSGKNQQSSPHFPSHIAINLVDEDPAQAD